MKKGEVLDWVEYAGTVINWLAGVVRSFPEKGKKKANGGHQQQANSTELDGQ